MRRQRIQIGAAVASLAIVASAAAYSNSGSLSFDFAQYQGTERQASAEDFRFAIVGDRTRRAGAATRGRVVGRLLEMLSAANRTA